MMLGRFVTKKSAKEADRIDIPNVLSPIGLQNGRPRFATKSRARPGIPLQHLSGSVSSNQRKHGKSENIQVNLFRWA